MDNHPSPMLFFETVNAYQRSAAIKAAVELGIFTAIGEGANNSAQLADKIGAPERGVRILCDYLVILGFLTKEAQTYQLTPDSAMFLDSRSPAYVGGAIQFLLAPMLTDAFKDLTAVVRKGSTLMAEGGSVAPEHPVWVDFARAMAPLMMMPAQLMVKVVNCEVGQDLKVLDIAAGHGVFGLGFAQHHPKAHITALDWPNVLEVARENAERAGVSDRYQLLPGSAFDVEYGSGYDLILITNFLHHFDAATCETFLRKVHAALADGGRAVTVEFVPNADRVSPPGAAAFSLTMLGTTPSGDAYTFAELESMFRNAGFSRSELHELPPTPQSVVISCK